ncbi:MAG: sorbosone dehydrogenase family protein, partial [Comamonadaceae bacterium]
MNAHQGLRPQAPQRSLLALLAGTMALANAQTLTPPGVGPNPQLPSPDAVRLLPTVNIAPAEGWPQGAIPQAVTGFKVTALARGLDHPRWLYVLPNGDVLVAESNKPEPEPGAKNVHADGLRGKAMGLVQKRAGAATPSANRITLLRDADGDGEAETRSVFLKDLVSPFGMALVGNQLYIANANAIVKVAYETGQTSITSPTTKVTDLPAGANHHWTKNILASPDGSKLYATVGSNSNIA